jgi:hypothetical protein
MMKKVHINKQVILIDCDMGTQDVGWLALAACYEYGNSVYPVTKYLPCMATNIYGETLHPKMPICKNDKKIGEEIFVKVKKKPGELDSEISEEEKLWFNQAFGTSRFLMNVKIKLTPSIELRAKDDFTYLVTLNLRILPNIAVFFPEYNPNVHTFALELEQIGNKRELYKIDKDIPMGALDFVKLSYRDKDGVLKDSFDHKNQIKMDKFPEPLLPEQKEAMISSKELLIKKKEQSLVQNIQYIEDEKHNEEIRLKALEQFLSSLPFSLSEIYEHTSKEIPDTGKKLIKIFNYFQADEFFLFKVIWKLFEFFCKFYDDNPEHVIDLESLIYFFKNFFDHKKEETSHLQSDFVKFYSSRVEVVSNYTFQDFIFTIVYLLHNIDIYKSIDIEKELYNISHLFNKRVSEEDGFKILMEDNFVLSLIISHLDFLKKLFENFSNRKFETYHEMSPNQFQHFVKESCKGKDFDVVSLIEKKFVGDLCFFEFLEKLIWIASKSNPEESELFTKVSEFIESLQNIWPDLV